MSRTWTWTLVGMALLGLLLGGCIVTTSSVRVRGAFRPATYSGHPVYFDSRVVPYYCDRAHRVRLPSQHRSRYVTFFYNHRAGYENWAAHHPPSCRGGGGGMQGQSHRGGRAHPRPSHRRR